MSLVDWFEDRLDPDEMVDVLGISVEELVHAFKERASEYRKSVEEEAEEDGF